MYVLSTGSNLLSFIFERLVEARRVFFVRCFIEANKELSQELINSATIAGGGEIAARGGADP